MLRRWSVFRERDDLRLRLSVSHGEAGRLGRGPCRGVPHYTKTNHLSPFPSAPMSPPLDAHDKQTSPPHTASLHVANPLLF